MFVIGPGVPAGQVVAHLTGNVDLAPTFAELASVTPSGNIVDGRSLVPLLGNNPPTIAAWRQAYLLGHGQYTTPGAASNDSVPVFSGLRTVDYKYVEYSTGERELYDLNSDPYELQNVAATSNPFLLSQLSSQLAQLRSCVGLGCQTAEDITTAAIQGTSPATRDNRWVLLEWPLWSFRWNLYRYLGGLYHDR